MQRSINLLREDHRQLLAAARTIVLLTQAPQPQPEAAFDALRDLALHVQAHILTEGQVMHRLSAEGVSTHAYDALRGDAFEQLCLEWNDFLREWSEENIAEDWETFGIAARAALRAVARQVEAEDEAFAPILETIGKAA